MPLCRAGELAELWRRGGLENVHEQPQTIAMRFESFADYWDPFLLGQGPAGAYVASLNRDQVRALRGGVETPGVSVSGSQGFRSFGARMVGTRQGPQARRINSAAVRSTCLLVGSSALAADPEKLRGLAGH